MVVIRTKLCKCENNDGNDNNDNEIKTVVRTKTMMLIILTVINNKQVKSCKDDSGNARSTNGSSS